MKDKISKDKYLSGGHAHKGLFSNLPSPRGIIPCAVIGSFIALVGVVIITFVISAILYQTEDPTKYIMPAAFSSLYISSLFGGFTASKLNKGSALLCGIGVGVILLLLTFVISLVIPNEHSSDYGVLESLSLRAALAICPVLGAFIGVSGASKSKKRKNHKKRE